MPQSFLVFTQFQVAPKAIPRLEKEENIISIENIDKSRIRLDFIFKEES